MSEQRNVGTVSIVGMGKLGASMAAGMASRGLNVISVDVDKTAVDAVNRGCAPVQETGLADMIRANAGRIRATLDFEEAVLGSDISFVVVPTPSDERGAFSTAYVGKAFAEIGRVLRKKSGYHVVVLTSTVLPGATRQVLLPILERSSEKRCGRDFGLCYSPEFIALGTVIRDFLNPDFYLVGEFDARSGDAIESVNRRITLNQARSKRMSIENAELAKIAINGYVTLKITYANMLSDICERLPGGDIDVVSDALGMDSRIGRKYLTGGFGFGGPCFPRDNLALSFIGESLGADCSIPRANDAFNRSISRRSVDKLHALLSKGQNVAVLGLAYKPQSHVIEESPGIFLCRTLADSGYRVIAFDPLANEAARSALGDRALIVDDIRDCLREAEAVIITTPDPQFAALAPADFLTRNRSVMIIDFWRLASKELAGHPQVRYIPMGRCIDDDAAVVRLAGVWASD